LIVFSDDSIQYLKKKGIKNIYLVLQYVQGPCNDNMCKLIPKVKVETSEPAGTRTDLVSEGIINVFSAREIAKTIEKQRNTIKISLTRVGERLKVDGLEY